MIPHYISEDNVAFLLAGASDILTGTDRYKSNGKGGSGDFLLSKNLKAKAIIQPDGNFVVYTGNFTFDGKALGDVSPVFASTQAFNRGDMLAQYPGPYQIILDQGLRIFKIGKPEALFEIIKLPQYYPGSQTLQLDDFGNLIYLINGKPIWSLFEIKMAQPPAGQNTSGNTQQQSGSTQNSTNSDSGFDINKYAIPIGAALVGLFLYLKK